MDKCFGTYGAHQIIYLALVVIFAISMFPNFTNGMNPDCFPTCKNCSGPAPNQCTSCFTRIGQNKIFYKGYCVTNCPVNTFLNSSNMCEDCDPTCLKCFGNAPTQCSSCNHTSEYPFYFEHQCFSSCENVTNSNGPNLFGNNSTITNQFCDFCDNNRCDTCFRSGPNGCTGCNPNGDYPVYNKNGNTCLSLYANFYSPQGGNCTFSCQSLSDLIFNQSSRDLNGFSFSSINERWFQRSQLYLIYFGAGRCQRSIFGSFNTTFSIQC